MIPSSYMRLEKFPLTPNHKIDRKNLPAPTLFYDSSNEDYVAPTNNYEKILAEVFTKSLGIERIGINDDIFNYPVDSLVIIQIQTMLITYGWKFKTQDFYKLRTIKELAIFVENQEKNNIANASTDKNEILSKEDEEKLIKLNNSLNKHDINNISVIPNEKEEVYLLTGCNGYLGIHILEKLLVNTNSHIHCLLRKKKFNTPEERLLSIWKKYFEKDLDISRITLYNCDMTKDDFGLSQNDYNYLANHITSVIHCAANVKYYGEYDYHEKINVNSVKNLITLCKKNSIHINHVSTLGVSGNYLVSQNKPNTIFTENDFYIGQNYKENVYIHSKFEAEKLLYENKENINFTIFRVGNLTGRTDGIFQHNIEDNAFYNILRFIINNKILPESMLKQNLEFTPVNICANALVKLSTLKNINHKIFHIFNNNTIAITDLLEMLSTFNINVNILDTDTFNAEVVKLSKKTESKETLKAVINDLDTKTGLSFMPSVIQNNDITNEYLYKLGIIWPNVTYEYIEKSLKHMKKNNYIIWEETNEEIL